ncbi:hypothetical protein GCM10023184_17820 [Flaviaesturariibacter amylovorans]|uniref:Uncharacterized protein n=1 Tax=Flaviaesturariibacter amylovorans TaxID=1084520 RepID=A0ABP8GQD4_9BACT
MLELNEVTATLEKAISDSERTTGRTPESAFLAPEYWRLLCSSFPAPNRPLTSIDYGGTTVQEGKEGQAVPVLVP